MANEVILRRFSSRHEAEQSQELLAAHGISSDIQADDCGGTDPSLAFANGVFLLVGSKDLKRAESVLTAGNTRR